MCLPAKTRFRWVDERGIWVPPIPQQIQISVDQPYAGPDASCCSINGTHSMTKGLYDIVKLWASMIYPWVPARLRSCFSILTFAYHLNCYFFWHLMSYFFNVNCRYLVFLFNETRGSASQISANPKSVSKIGIHQMGELWHKCPQVVSKCVIRVTLLPTSCRCR
jgi:hypothetical protein